MTVVSDTSAVLNLARIGRLGLLVSRYRHEGNCTHHHPMTGGQSPAVLPAVRPADRRQIRLIDDVADESRRVCFRQPVLQGWRR